MKRITGIVILVVGVVAFGLSMYIDKQTGEGRTRIEKGEKQVRQLERVTSVTPPTAVVGRVATSSAKQKIAKGRQDVAWYDSVSGWLKVGGGVFIVAGLIALIFSRK